MLREKSIVLTKTNQPLEIKGGNILNLYKAVAGNNINFAQHPSLTLKLSDIDGNVYDQRSLSSYLTSIQPNPAVAVINQQLIIKRDTLVNITSSDIDLDYNVVLVYSVN